MGNAQRISAVLSGKTSAGTFTGSGGTVSVPYIAGMKPGMTLSRIGKLIDKGEHGKAMEGIGKRRENLMAMFASIPSTQESVKSMEIEFGQLNKLHQGIENVKKQELVNEGKVGVQDAKNRKAANKAGLEAVKAGYKMRGDLLKNITKVTPAQLHAEARRYSQHVFQKNFIRLYGADRKKLEEGEEVPFQQANWWELKDNYPTYFEGAKAKYNLQDLQVRPAHLMDYITETKFDNFMQIRKDGVNQAMGGFSLPNAGQQPPGAGASAPSASLSLPTKKVDQIELSTKLLKSMANRIKSGMPKEQVLQSIEANRGKLMAMGYSPKAINGVIATIKRRM